MESLTESLGAAAPLVMSAVKALIVLIIGSWVAIGAAWVVDTEFGEEEAVALLVNGFVREVLQELPMEFAVEAQSLLKVSLEGSVG